MYIFEYFNVSEQSSFGWIWLPRVNMLQKKKKKKIYLKNKYMNENK